jgi:hypothetical protein
LARESAGYNTCKSQRPQKNVGTTVIIGFLGSPVDELSVNFPRQRFFKQLVELLCDGPRRS